MIMGLFLFALGAFIGWRRAARRGGGFADKLQYALAHGIPAFLVGMVLRVAAAHFGVLG